jgi:hypothetical protein
MVETDECRGILLLTLSRIHVVDASHAYLLRSTQDNDMILPLPQAEVLEHRWAHQ